MQTENIGTVHDLGVCLLANSSTSKSVEILAVFIDVRRIVRIEVAACVSVENDCCTNRLGAETRAETVEDVIEDNSRDVRSAIEGSLGAA